MAIDFPNSPTNGQEFSSGSVTWVYDGTVWNLKSTTATTNDSMPVGAILWFGNTTTTPLGFIAADGSAVSRTTYATLFAVIGTTHGAGDGSTTFNVPSVAATTGKYYIRYTTALGTVTTTSLSTAPVGTMIDWPVTTSFPTGWLRADGSNVSRTSYADLFSLIGTTYGSGDGSTTFTLPNIVSAGSGSPVGIIKASLGGIVEPSTVAHAASHTAGGSDPVTVTLNQVSEYQSNRNVIINGAMQVAQRGTSTASITTSGYYTADRYSTAAITLGTWTQSVENDAPTGSGLRKSLKMLCTTADASPAAADVLRVDQVLEGQDLQRIAKGTASAKSLVLTFWVKANVIGTYIVSLYDNDNTRHVAQSYTISASGTWEKKTVTFPADTTGAFDNDNAASLYVQFYLAAGSNRTSGALATSWASYTAANDAAGQTNLASAINNFWQVTGVQLEVGSVSTPFEFEPFETTLRKCQRYYTKINSSGFTYLAMGQTRASTIYALGFMYKTPVTMRIAPNSVTINNLAVEPCAGGTIAMTNGNVTASSYNTTNNIGFYTTRISGTFSTNEPVMLVGLDSTSFIDFSAEL